MGRQNGVAAKADTFNSNQVPHFTSAAARRLHSHDLYTRNALSRMLLRAELARVVLARALKNGHPLTALMTATLL
jgi:hypothetical protein